MPQEDEIQSPQSMEDARTVDRLVLSLASFVVLEDAGLSRTDFLRKVAERIIDEIDP
jgi:hypothetical protein